MACVEKIRLLDRYAAATSALYSAVAKLQSKTGAEFREGLATSETARAECTKARRALRDHSVQHGC